MSIDAMKQALEALEECTAYTSSESWSPSMTRECETAITALRAAIEQAQEPVACNSCKEWEKVCDQHLRHIKKLKKSRACQWQGLTDEDREDILRWIEWKEIGSQPVAPQKLIAYVEKKLKEKNT